MISLMVVGGSALAIADQYDTIDGHEWVYQNEELLALNEQGLVCKPLSNDPKDVAASSTWIGQLPNGDWIVGLFNREDTYRSGWRSRWICEYTGAPLLPDTPAHNHPKALRGRSSFLYGGRTKRQYLFQP